MSKKKKKAKPGPKPEKKKSAAKKIPTINPAAVEPAVFFALQSVINSEVDSHIQKLNKKVKSIKREYSLVCYATLGMCLGVAWIVSGLVKDVRSLFNAEEQRRSETGISSGKEKGTGKAKGS